MVLNFYTPLAIFFFASMLYDLVISRGEEEIEKPDLTVVFYTDIAASCVPVYANQTWSFLHMILSTGSQSLVNFVPVSPTVFYLHVYPFYVYIDLCSFHIKYRTSVQYRKLCCYILPLGIRNFSMFTAKCSSLVVLCTMGL